MVQNTLTQLEVSPETTSTSNTPFDCLAVEGVPGTMDSQLMARTAAKGSHPETPIRWASPTTKPLEKNSATKASKRAYTTCKPTAPAPKATPHRSREAAERLPGGHPHNDDGIHCPLDGEH
jgi:hypothetical protein